MTEFSIPNIFTAGTKAKAYEVNENFAAVKNAINNNADSTAQNAQNLTSLEDYVNGDFKDEIENLVDSISKIGFCVNSAYNPLLAINPTNPSKLDFNVDDGTEYLPLVATPLPGAAFKRTSIPSLDMSGESEGTYNIFAGETGNAEAYINAIYAQNLQPDNYTTYWAQPILTSNASHDDFIITNSTCMNPLSLWQAFDNNAVTYNIYIPGAVYGWGYFYVEFKVPKKLSYIYARGDNIPNVAVELAGVQVYKVEDSVETLLVNQMGVVSGINFSLNNTVCKKVKIGIYGTGASHTYPTRLQTIILSGEDYHYILEDDIWVDTSCEPLKSLKYNGSAWEEFNLVPIGRAALTSSGITNVETFGFNQNGHNVNMQTLKNNASNFQKWNMPNLVTGVSKAPNVVHTAEKNQWLKFQTNITNATVFLYVNGIDVIAHYSSANTADVKANWFPVYKGQTYICTYNTLTAYDFIGGN